MSDIYHLVARLGDRPEVVIPVAEPTALVVENGAPAGRPWQPPGSGSELCVAAPGAGPGPLAVARAASARMLWNGEPAPLLAEGAERDEFIFPRFDLAVHVTVFREATLRTATEALAGRICLLCRAPLVPGSTVYHCACGVVLCAERGGCAADAKNCPRCAQPVTPSTKGCFTHWPPTEETS
ncbi:MAG: hypothetical protein KA248_01990 [Kiritimatiellae bacterium]|nr:hypothetical protein [Kiritimatiellia bacterium]